MIALLPFVPFLLLSGSLGVLAADECQPVTWANPVKARDAADAAPTGAMVMARAAPELEARQNGSLPLQPGDINCRFVGRTYDVVNYYTCTELAETFQTTVDTIFKLNPFLKKDCSIIAPNTEYCVRGFIEPLRSTNGRCGPQFNNATCRGTAKQCCNADTFTCGDTFDDCEDGTCYEGACQGDKIWSTDGTCGPAHGDRKCAGRWGDCCNQSGRCGSGDAFCNESVCQSGNCNWPWRPSTTASTTRTRTTATSTSTTPPVPSATQQCSGGTGSGNYATLCPYTCSYGFCPSPCTCMPGTPATPPPLTTVRGYTMIQVKSDLGALCDYPCSQGFCPSAFCVTTPYTTVQQPGTVCVKGNLKPGGATTEAMCNFCCQYGACPPVSCTCTLYGVRIPVPSIASSLFATCPDIP